MRMVFRVERKIGLKEKSLPLRVLNILTTMFLFGLVFPFGAPAMDVTLQWDSNIESDVTGYVIYYKTAHSGGRVKENYTNQVELPLDDDEYQDNPNLFVQYTIHDLEDEQNYAFVVTAFDSEVPRKESAPSNVASTDNIPPGTLSNLTHAFTSDPDPKDKKLEMHWSGADDPDPGSGLAGYSYVFDSSPSSIPDDFLDADKDATSASVPFMDGLYWFHIRAADAAGRTGKSNWGEPVHYGPILVETRPPSLVGKPILDPWDGAVYVFY